MNNIDSKMTLKEVVAIRQKCEMNDFKRSPQKEESPIIISAKKYFPVL